MEDTKEIIANNLTNLRKRSKLTQSELGKKLNYSDKAVSKWENGDALPDVEVLLKLATIYGVTLDYLTTKDPKKLKELYANSQRNKNNKVIISLLAVSVVWIMATITFVYAGIAFNQNHWMLFIYSVPTSCLVLIVFNSIWGGKKLLLALTSILIWTLIISLYLAFLEYNIWLIFLIGIPSQITVILWGQLKRK